MCTRNSEINQFMNRLSLRNESTNFNVSNILGQNGNTLNLLDTLNIKNLSHEVFDEYVGLADDKQSVYQFHLEKYMEKLLKIS